MSICILTIFVNETLMLGGHNRDKLLFFEKNREYTIHNP